MDESVWVGECGWESLDGRVWVGECGWAVADGRESIGGCGRSSVRELGRAGWGEWARGQGSAIRVQVSIVKYGIV